METGITLIELRYSLNLLVTTRRYTDCNVCRNKNDGSSKSYNTALKLVLKLLTEKRKALVVRQVFDTLRESCFSLLCEIIETLGVEHIVKTTVSPMKIKFSNGSEIIFKGCDKPEKLKSLNGVSIVWLEEAPEINYTAFKELIGRLRTPGGVFLLLSSNPVSENSWTFKHFFTDKKIDPEELYSKREIFTADTYYHHSVVYDNAFVSDEYKAGLEEYKEYDLDLYRIACLGRFGQLGEKVFSNIELQNFEEVEKAVSRIHTRHWLDGLDLGFSVSYNAFTRCAIDTENNYLYIYDSFYNKGLINSEITALLTRYKNTYHSIIADSSRPELIEEVKRSGVRIKETLKGKGSVKEGIEKIRSFRKVIISDKCKDCYEDLKNLTYKTDKDGNVIEGEFSWDSHWGDAVRYAIEDYRHVQMKHGKVVRPKGL